MGKIKKSEMSTRKYAAHLMSQSLVTGVSNITLTANKVNKAFKFMVLIFCTVGFFYQTTQFVMFFLTYPHVVDIEMYTPERIMHPSYIFCNYNSIKRSKFCAKYPDKCYIPSDMKQFCKKYKDFCNAFEDTNNITIPKPEMYDNFEKNVSLEELIELGPSLKDVKSNEVPKNEFFGPFLLTSPESRLLLCYSIYNRADSNLEPYIFDTPSKLYRHINEFDFDLEPHEMFRPDRKPGVLFSIQSPFEFNNPVYHGTFIRIDRIYAFHISMEEEHLLPYPYKSDCLNYTERWEENGRTGPRSQTMSYKACLFNLLEETCNCSMTMYPVSYENKTICLISDVEFMAECWKLLFQDYDGLMNCMTGHGNECIKLKYNYNFESRHQEGEWEDTGLHRRSKVEIIMKDEEVKKYRFRPQYQDLEVFSYIGGFLGAWIGVSMVAVTDLFESIVMIIIHAIKNKKIRDTKMQL